MSHDFILLGVFHVLWFFLNYINQDFHLKNLFICYLSKSSHLSLIFSFLWSLDYPFILIFPILSNGLLRPKNILRIIISIDLVSFERSNPFSVRNIWYGRWKNIENNKQTDENVNISVSHCFFSRAYIYSGHGVIFIDDLSSSMRVNYQCSIIVPILHEEEQYSYTLLNHIWEWFVLTDAHFALLYASHMNQAEYQSITNCSYTTSNYYSFYFYLGDQKGDKTNNSMNNADAHPSICIFRPFSFTSSHLDILGEKR